MTSQATAHLTFDEFERLPSQPGKLELLRGELIELPPAKRVHNEIARRIFFGLHQHLSDAQRLGLASELGEVYFEMGYRLEGSWLQPDVSITHARQLSGEYFLQSPALAVEVVSDGNSADEMEGKVAEYLATGAREVWVLYPKRRHLWVYKPDGTGEAHATPFHSALLGATVDVAAFLP